MSNFLLNLQSVCDSSKTDDTFVFLPLQERPLQEKSRSADARPDIPMLFQTDWKTSPTFLSRKTMGQFQHRLHSLRIQTKMVKNLKT